MMGCGSIPAVRMSIANAPLPWITTHPSNVVAYHRQGKFNPGVALTKATSGECFSRRTGSSAYPVATYEALVSRLTRGALGELEEFLTLPMRSTPRAHRSRMKKQPEVEASFLGYDNR
jgi:hypothetical protein